MHRINKWIGLVLITGGLLLSGCSEAESAPPKDPNTSKPKPSFPPVDLTCAQDTDCDTHHRYLTDDGRCCYTCNHKVGAKTWIKAVMDECSKRSTEGCPMKKCVAPPPVKCIKNKCAFDPPAKG